MSKYFMGGTRLSGLERMMMDPSRTPPPSADFRRRRPREQPPAKPAELIYDGQTLGLVLEQRAGMGGQIC